MGVFLTLTFDETRFCYLIHNIYKNYSVNIIIKSIIQNDFTIYGRVGTGMIRKSKLLQIESKPNSAICICIASFQEPFDVVEFIERLTWRTNNEVGNDQFDSDFLHETFSQTIKDLRMLQERQQRKCERLDDILSEERGTHAKHVENLQDRHRTSVDWFRQLDEKINSVAGKIIHLGEQLENVNTPRSRTVEAQRLLNHMTEFLIPGTVRNIS